MKKIILLLLIIFAVKPVYAQTSPNEKQLGAWYMYFFQKKFKKIPLGFQGDLQLRTWNGNNDFEQLLLRSGVSYRPSADITYTAGYAFVKTGEFGESSKSFIEHRIYEEALFPQVLASRFFITHRIRYEQRWVEGQSFRTRFRQFIGLNIPLNKKSIKKNALYLAIYNELFINGERSIGNGRTVQLFDRNRFYAGLGYSFTNNLRLQTGWMLQSTAGIRKAQLQLGLHHTF